MASRRIVPTMVAASTVWILAVLACAPGEDATPKGVRRRAQVVEFSGALARGEVRADQYALGRESRPSLVPLASAGRFAFSFESEPFELGADAELVGALGMLPLAGPLVEADRPRFRMELVGPEGSELLLEREGQRDVPPDAWIPYRLRLPASLGSPVRLRLEIPLDSGYLAATPRALPVWSQPTLLQGRAGAEPNVLLVVFDTLRADHTPPWGYERETAPFLGELAQRGALIERVIAPYPTTLSSHWSLFSGLDPVGHGVYPGQGKVRRPQLRTLAESFRDHGYRTAAFTEGGYVHSIFGFDTGFELYHDGGSSELESYDQEAGETFARALAWLTGEVDSPWMLFLHTYQVHVPYRPPPELLDRLEGDYRGRWADGLPVEDVGAVNEGRVTLNPEEKQHIRNLYDAEILHLDQQFRAFWKAIEASGRLENTLVVITSDHGEDLFEHGWLGHGTTLFDPALRVPLLVIWPGEVAEGARLACQRALVDVAPTLLELAGLPALSDIDGRSLAAELRSGVCQGNRVAFSELVHPTYRRHIEMPAVSVTTGRWKLIWHRSSGKRALYDLLNDPAEQNDVSAEHASLVDQLEGAIRRYVARLQAKGGADVPDAVRERLRELGYLEP